METEHYNISQDIRRPLSICGSHATISLLGITSPDFQNKESTERISRCFLFPLALSEDSANKISLCLQRTTTKNSSSYKVAHTKLFNDYSSYTQRYRLLPSISKTSDSLLLYGYIQTQTIDLNTMSNMRYPTMMTIPTKINDSDAREAGSPCLGWREEPQM